MGDWSVSLLVSAPVLAALTLAIFAALVRTPALVSWAKNSSIKRTLLQEFALFRDTAADRADLSLVGTREFTTRIEKARHAAGGDGKRVFDLAAATALLVERTLIGLNLWLLKAPADGHHPPEAYATLVALPLIAGALALSLRTTTKVP